MITIKENLSDQVGGRTSLWIKTPYKSQVIDLIKSCDFSFYHSKTQEWETTINNLAYLLDNLTYLDDITFTPFQEPSLNAHSEPILTYKTKPFDYQLQAIEYGLNHDKWLLLDQMGLGKTKTIINLAEELKAQRNIKHCLVICGVASLKTNWKKEIYLHSNLSCRILGERVNTKGKIYWATLEERAKELEEDIEEFFVITNIETLRTDSKKGGNKLLENLIKQHFDMIVLDEAHKVASPNSKQTKGLLQLKAKYKVALTGTPIINNPLDLYVPLKWIEVNKCNFTNYRKTFCIMDTKILGRVRAFKNMDLLKEELECCSLRRTKEMLPNLPKKTIINEFLDMDDKQAKFIESVEEGIKDEKMKVELLPNNILAMITRLRQALVEPKILTDEEIPSIKINRCVELIKQFTDNNEKVVVFSNFKEPIYSLERLLKDKYKVLVGTGDIKDSIIFDNIEKFQTNDEYKIFLATTSKLGTGITLNKATYCIFLDLPLTSSAYNQACDRVHRVNNDHPVFIYNLIVSNTLDEYVLNLIERKQATSDFIVDNQDDDKTLTLLKKYLVNL